MPPSNTKVGNSQHQIPQNIIVIELYETDLLHKSIILLITGENIKILSIFFYTLYFIMFDYNI